jgi:hypothetical protein
VDTTKDEVKENEKFPEIGAGEESVTIGHKKNGRMVSLSKEVIEENDYAGFMERVNACAEFCNDSIENLTLDRVTDRLTAQGVYVYRPEGTGTALYSSTANTPGTRAPSGNLVTSNAFVDGTDLAAAQTRLYTYLNHSGAPLNTRWSNVCLLVPFALINTVLTLLNSEYTPGVVNERNTWGPLGMYHIPKDRIITTPLLDSISATTWYLGDFKKVFRRKWKMRLENVFLGTSTEAYLQQQIAAQFRCAYDCEVGAIDYVGIVKCTA